MMKARLPAAILASGFLLSAASAGAVVVAGGGSKTTDCMAVFDVVGANHPAPPKVPKNVDCVDGDVACDTDGLRNGECVFGIQVCLNSTALAECAADEVVTAEVDHADDDGDTKFDPDFQALEMRILTLGLPTFDADTCTVSSSISVPLRAPSSGNEYRKANKKVKVTLTGNLASNSDVTDKDKMKFTCRPEGDGVYLPVDLFEGTFDRIREQIFAQSCALSGCHDSESATGDLILLSSAAYSQLVGVTPDNPAAAGAGLQRIFPGDPDLSFLYRKIIDDLEVGWGSSMPDGAAPLSPDQAEIIRLWIIGDGILGAAPETGWVPGTDQ
jgi:hypothetical protein